MNDKQLVAFTRSFRRGIMGRKRNAQHMCFAICSPLAALLELNDVPVILREGRINHEVGYSNHFWIDLPDGRVLDPTADQFNRMLNLNLPPIYLGEPTVIHNPA